MEWSDPEYVLTSSEVSAHQENADRFARTAIKALGRFAAFAAYHPDANPQLLALRNAITDAIQTMEDGRV